MSTLLLSGLELEVEITQRLCLALPNAPRSPVILQLLKEQDYAGILALQPDYTIQDHGDFADDYLLVSVLKKSQYIPFQGNLDGAKSAADVAKQKFYSAEKLCKETNDRLMSVRYVKAQKCLRGTALSEGDSWSWYPDTSEPDWVLEARGLIAEILGSLYGDPSPFESILGLMRHGPGSTTGVTGDGLVSSQKFDNQVELTQELVPFAATIMGSNWVEYKTQSALKVVNGNMFFSVPKDATQERGACKGATLNVFGQLGIGTYITERLRVFGCDLLQGHVRQRWLASRAQNMGLATIDLSQASDMIAYMVVLLLLPHDWFHLLDTFREKKTLIDGVWVDIQKFCAMGNGFTFPLESLIFLAVVRSIVPKSRWTDCGVFGDDIICPAEHAEAVIQALIHLGMRVNTKKTFLAGRFFESCGTDWHDGHDVRPFYLRQSRDSKIPYQLQVANAIRLYSHRRNGVWGCDSRFQDTWNWLVEQVPAPWNECSVPPEFGDTGIIRSRSEANPRKAQCESLAPLLPRDGAKVRKTPKPGFSDSEVALSRFVRRSGDFNGWLDGYSCRHIVMAAVNVDRRTYGVLLAGLAASDPAWVKYEPDLDLYVPWNQYTCVAELRNLPTNPVTWARQLAILASPSRGLEPRRGFLGKITTKASNVLSWTDELTWV